MKRLIICLYAIPGLLATGASVALLEPTLVMLWSGLACGVTLLIAGALLGFARYKGQPLGPVLAGGILCLAIIASMAIVHWPLRAAYFLSRPALNTVAQEVRAGQPFVGPARVGLFTIARAEVSRAGIVCLWVDLNPAGKTGFVQCAPRHVPFNLWSMVSLDDRWQFIAED